MAKLVILQDNHPALRQESAPLALHASSALVRTMIKDMVDTMREHNGVGLAAPQVAWQVRLILVQVDGKGFPPTVMINPRILTATGTQASNEGCLSVDRAQWFTRPVRRFKRVQLTYTDEHGVLVHRRLHGHVAAIVQHEIDHLDGILFTDRLKQQEVM